MDFFNLYRNCFVEMVPLSGETDGSGALYPNKERISKKQPKRNRTSSAVVLGPENNSRDNVCGISSNLNLHGAMLLS